MQEKAPVFQTKNAHSEKFDKFHNSRLFDRLGNKFTPKPYWKQYKVLHVVAVVSGLFFHVFSAGCAAALVYFFILALTENAVLAGLLTLVGLGLLEVAKRFTAEKLFHTYFQFHRIVWGLAAVAVLLAGLSISAAYFGAQRAVHEFTPPPVLVTADTVTAALNARLAAVDEQIKDAKKNTWKGKLSERSQRTVDKLTAQRERIVTALLDREQRVQDTNDATVQTHRATTTDQGLKFALFVLLSELLLIGCLAYCEYYDYRSYAELCAPDPDGGNDNQPPTPPLPFSANRKDRVPTAHIPVDQGDQDAGNAWERVFDQSVGSVTSTQTRPSVNNGSVITEPLVTHPLKKTCDHCGKAYTAKVAWQRFCSEGCKLDHHQDKHGTRFDPKRRKPKA